MGISAVTACSSCLLHAVYTQREMLHFKTLSSILVKYGFLIQLGPLFSHMMGKTLHSVYIFKVSIEIY